MLGPMLRMDPLLCREATSGGALGRGATKGAGRDGCAHLTCLSPLYPTLGVNFMSTYQPVIVNRPACANCTLFLYIKNNGI